MSCIASSHVVFDGHAGDFAQDGGSVMSATKATPEAPCASCSPQVHIVQLSGPIENYKYSVARSHGLFCA